jgi:hypothetical protein
MVCVSWGVLALLPSLSAHVNAVDKKKSKSISHKTGDLLDIRLCVTHKYMLKKRTAFT